MKLSIKYILVAAAAVLFIQSCKKSEDYFISPNDPINASLPTLLSALEVGTMNTYEGELARTSSILVQQNVGAVFQSQDAQFYNLIEDQYNNQWEQLYQTLNNAKKLNALASTKNPYYSGISNVMSAMNWAVIADLWGDAPYLETLQIDENLTPKFDKQEIILAGIINMLDAAIVDFNKANADNIFMPGSDDLIFGGDISLWTKTAYTLKARYLNRYSNKTTYNPTEILAALSMGISSNAENCMAVHGGGNAQNQWYAFENNRGYIVSSKTLVDSLLMRPTDMRASYYFGTNDSGIIAGSPIDDISDGSEVSRWGSYIAGSESTPFPMVTFAEAKFIEAEVLARTGAAAETALNDAIMASCDAVTGGAYDGADIAIYDATTTDLSRVMYEKWLGSYGQIESYNDYRRTGYPMLTPNPQGITSVIPKRLPIPQNERVNNPNATSPAITTPVWWAQ